MGIILTATVKGLIQSLIVLANIRKSRYLAADITESVNLNFDKSVNCSIGYAISSAVN